MRTTTNEAGLFVGSRRQAPLGRRSINAVIDALFIAVLVRVVFALVWGIYFLYPIKGHEGLGFIVRPFGDAFAGPLHEGQVAMG